MDMKPIIKQEVKLDDGSTMVFQYPGEPYILPPKQAKKPGKNTTVKEKPEKRNSTQMSLQGTDDTQTNN